jgi:hypothetical protein
MFWSLPLVGDLGGPQEVRTITKLTIKLLAIDKHCFPYRMAF